MIDSGLAPSVTMLSSTLSLLYRKFDLMLQIERKLIPKEKMLKYSVRHLPVKVKAFVFIMIIDYLFNTAGFV